MKTTDKTEKHLNKSEKKEQSTLRDLHKATDRHEQAKMKTTHLVEELGVSSIISTPTLS